MFWKKKIISVFDFPQFLYWSKKVLLCIDTDFDKRVLGSKDGFFF